MSQSGHKNNEEFQYLAKCTHCNNGSIVATELKEADYTQIATIKASEKFVTEQR